MSETSDQATSVKKSLEESKENKELKSKRIRMRRFRFAMKCLHTIMQIDGNSVLCPHILFDGLLIIYLSQNLYEEADIRNYISRILNIEGFAKSDLKYYIESRKQKQLEKWKTSASNYIDDCLCWIEEDSNYCSYLEEKKFFELNRINFADSPREKISGINKIIKKYTPTISDSLKLNENSENMEMILTNIIRFSKVMYKTNSATNQPDAPKVSTHVGGKMRKSFFSAELGIYVNEFLLLNDVASLYILLPATLDKKKGWRITEFTDGDIIRMVYKLSEKEAAFKLQNLLHSNTTLEGDDEGFTTCPNFELEHNLKIREE